MIQNASKKISLIFALSLITTNSIALLEQDPLAYPGQLPISHGFFIEYLQYRDHLYTLSRKTEVGDQMRLDAALRYEFDKDSFGRLRFATDPNRNQYDNKTSRFEFLLGRRINTWLFQFDAELNTNDKESGGTSLGLKTDSRLTYATWKPTTKSRLTFYPFNFDGQVGRVFNIRDVTEIHYIKGTPDTISSVQNNDEFIASKTIPGIEFAWAFDQSFQKFIYTGFGATSYLYPHSADFNIRDENNLGADRWQRRETLAVKAGIYWRSPNHRFEAKYVTHTESGETGSLLDSGAFFYSINNFGSIRIENELTYSKAGTQPYRLTRSGQWFEDIATFLPVYSDRLNRPQDWINRSGFGYSVRTGLNQKHLIPYLSYKYQSKHFIYRERESAHILRTYDESESHGGLHRIGFGTYYNIGDFVINPEFEWMIAQNRVFNNASDIRQDKFISNYRRQDFSLYFVLTYQFGENRVFRP